MIPYNDGRSADFAEFGIQMPIRDSRFRRTFEALMAAEHLYACADRWFRRPARVPVGQPDIARAHSADYVVHLFSDRLEQEIIRTYKEDQKPVFARPCVLCKSRQPVYDAVLVFQTGL